MSDIAKAKRNVKRMIDGGASEQEIDKYLASEGLTAKDLRGEGGAFQYIDDIVRRAASGSTFGYADEFAAGMGAATGIGGKFGDYQGNVEAQRARDDEFFQSNPVTATTAEIAGGVASPLNKFMGAGAIGNRFFRGAAQGAMGGFLAGSGNATEGNRLAGGMIGGSLGAGLGAALPAVAQGVYSIGRAGVNRFVAPKSQAGRRLSRAFIRDEMSIDDAQARLRELGPEATMADLGGNVRGLAEASAQQPGRSLKAAEGLRTRQGGQGERLMSDALRFAGAESVDELIKKRAEAAQPYYEQAFSQDVYRTIRSPLIARLQTRPDFQEGMRAGIKDVLDEAAITGEDLRAFNEFFDGNDLNDPALVLTKEPTLRIIDAAKRGMDRLLSDNPGGKYMKENGEFTTAGMRLSQMRDALVKETEKEVAGTPHGDAWLQARELWAGPTDVINGLSLIQRTIEKTIDGRDVTAKLFGSPDARKKLNRLFSKKPEAMQEFAKSVMRERTFTDTAQQVNANSRTHFRDAAQADMQDNAIDAAFDIAQNPTATNIVSKASGAVRNWLTAPPTEVADELAPMLFSADRAVQNSALQSLRQRVALGSLMRPPAQAALTGLSRAGGYSGGLIGGSNQ